MDQAGWSVVVDGAGPDGVLGCNFGPDCARAAGYVGCRGRGGEGEKGEDGGGGCGRELHGDELLR